MDNDDRPIGKVLSRREALLLMGLAGARLLVGCGGAGGASSGTSTSTSTSSGTGGGLCVVRPQQTEGPYFVDEMLNRSDIRMDPADGTTRPGTPLRLDFNLSQLAGSTCNPLGGWFVDVWHCDALGVYSDVNDPGFNTLGKRFLRGYQITDTAGFAGFTTIYPGWYQGRTVHVHFKIRSALASSPGLEFTSQLYFDDTLTDTVHAQQPYAAKGQRTLRNPGDGIYAQGGSQLTLAAAPDAQGYAAMFDIAIQ